MSTCGFCGDTYDILAVSQCPTCRARCCAFPDATFRAPGHADTDQILALFIDVLATNPDYLPGVTSGAVPLHTWYARKDPQWTRVVVADGQIVAHLATRLNDMLPDGRRLDGHRMWEMGMLVVHPDHRRRGYATALIDIAARVFGDRLWATAHTDTPGQHLLTDRDWAHLDSFTWKDDPHPGVALANPNGRTR